MGLLGVPTQSAASHVLVAKPARLHQEDVVVHGKAQDLEAGRDI